jgi:hypothetical protein
MKLIRRGFMPPLHYVGRIGQWNIDEDKGKLHLEIGKNISSKFNLNISKLEFAFPKDAKPYTISELLGLGKVVSMGYESEDRRRL